MLDVILALLLCYEVDDLDLFLGCGSTLLLAMPRFLRSRSCRVHRVVHVLYLERIFLRGLGRLPLHYDIALWTLLRNKFLAFSFSELAVSQDLRLPKLLVAFILAHAFVRLLVAVA